MTDAEIVEKAMGQEEIQRRIQSGSVGNLLENIQALVEIAIRRALEMSRDKA